MRGAAFLTGATDTLIADVGGTSTDIGILTNGYPRESSVATEIGGIRTNFRMPDLVAIALGGGTIVANGDRGLRVGPRSVGYEILSRALVFGGDTPTLTDAAVAAGRADFGSPEPARSRDGVLTEALKVSDAMLADAVAQMKLTKADCPLIAVGGASHLVPDQLPGVSEVIRPEHHEVANAIGAAIASVSGQVDCIVHLDQDGGRSHALEAVQAEARDRAIRAGADPRPACRGPA
jgi:N-methylhydantoinase A/oxoprolinase/acetone carboxylase beta subunit